MRGIKINWSYGISTPRTDDIKGILKVLCAIGIFVCKITPPCIWHCGTVGEMKG